MKEENVNPSPPSSTKARSLATVVPYSNMLMPPIPIAGMNKAETASSLAAMPHSVDNRNAESSDKKDSQFNSERRKVRKDRNGAVIEKASKSHHITFRDLATGKELADIRVVECYKTYNRVDEEAETTTCSCVLL